MRPLRLRHLRFLRPWLALAAVLLWAAPAVAAFMIAPPPYRPKDFTVVKKDGQFHLFYIRHDIGKANDDTEKDFGHAVSADLYTWVQLPPVIPAQDDSWDNLHVWAPYIVLLDGVYYMFYTGVTQHPGQFDAEQRTGIATSTDLMTWNRLDAPIWSCRDVPWSWCDSTDLNPGFRDVFVMPNPSAPGHWLMYTTTFPASDHTGMLVDIAGSDGDLTQWDDLGPLWITHYTYSFNTLIESPHLFKHAGLWFLFFTTNAGQPISYCVGTNPTGPPSQWAYRGRLSNMIGIDTRSWYASEYFADGLRDNFAFVNFNRIEMYKMLWTGPETFALFEPGNFHVQSLTWSPTVVEKGQSATLSVVATGWNSQQVQLQAAERMADGSEQPVAIQDLGIPALLPLTSDTTRFQWTSTIVHANGDTTGAENIVLRTADLTAEAAPITVNPPPPPLEIHNVAWSAGSAFAGGDVDLEVVASEWSGHQVTLEALERLPEGGEAPLAIEDLGLPSTLPLTGDTTRVTWTTRIRRPSGDSTTVLLLVVRASASPAVESEPLKINPAELPGDPGGEPLPELRPIRIRLLAKSVFGDLPSFLLELPSPQAVRLDLYDLQGRRLRNLVDRVLPAGATVVAWDGLDAGGRPMGRGLYFARLATPSMTRTVKLALTRPAGGR